MSPAYRAKQVAVDAWLRRYGVLVAVLLVALVLAGCVTDGTGSVKGSCKVFDAPKYAVRGARPYDQDWIDSTIEDGVGACKWARPAPRPAELDAVKAPPAPKVVVKKKKPGWIWGLKWNRPRPAVVATPEPPPVELPAVEVPAPPAPLPPRSAIDILLHPDGVQ